MITSRSFGPFARQRQGRVVAGVCVGIARAARVDTSVVRLATLLLCLAGGVGFFVYGVAWAVLPSTVEVSLAPRPQRVDDAGALLAVFGVLLILRGLGAWFSDRVALVGAVAAIGVVLVWGRSDAPGGFTANRGSALRIAVGLALLIVGSAAAIAFTGDVATVGRTLLGAVVAVAGIGLLAGPRVARLVSDLADERRARIRSEEKADLASHLHDGVLQTLALIQHRSGDNREVAALARRQERELRNWLYGAHPTIPVHLAEALRAELGAVEDDLEVRVELVCVGDADLDEAGRALVAAVREAATNSARHAGVERVDVYAEVEPERITAFVRDRGRGFDPGAVPSDRRGLADSVIGRIRRAGGATTVRSQLAEGTEITVSVPRRSQ